MSELSRLLNAYDTHRAAGRACALVTVVHVAGSAYRRPGARMLVTADGELTGTVSGGCLEGDARRRAQQALHRGQPTVVEYDSTDVDDELAHGTQLGCQGRVQLLLEPLAATPDNPLELLREAHRQDAPAVLATVFGGPAAGLGQRLLLTAAGMVRRSRLLADPLAADLLAEARQVLASGRPTTWAYEAAGEPAYLVFFEWLAPAPRLAVYGAGNDAQPLVQLAAGLGWRVAVLDGRPALATAARFPAAEAVRVLPLVALATHPVSADFVVLLTHNYPYELAALRVLARRPAVRYLGVLGPRKKAQRLLADLAAEGLDTEATLLPRLFAPVGLNVGAETAEEIAVAVMAELLAVCAGRPAGFLREAPGPIHSPTAELVARTAGALLVAK